VILIKFPTGFLWSYSHTVYIFGRQRRNHFCILLSGLRKHNLSIVEAIVRSRDRAKWEPPLSLPSTKSYFCVFRPSILAFGVYMRGTYTRIEVQVQIVSAFRRGRCHRKVPVVCIVVRITVWTRPSCCITQKANNNTIHIDINI